MYKNMKVEIDEIPTKKERVTALFECLKRLPNAHSSTETHAQISNCMNLLEDQLLGHDEWGFPRTFHDGTTTKRMHGSHTDCMEYVPFYPGVMNMVHTNHFIFISASGAIEMQLDTEEDEEKIPFSTRRKAVIFEKPDANGRTVWDELHRDETFTPKIQQPIIKNSYPLVELYGWSPLAKLPDELKEAIYKRFLDDIDIENNVTHPSQSTQKLRDVFRKCAVGNAQEIFNYCIKKINLDDDMWSVFTDIAFAVYSSGQSIDTELPERPAQIDRLSQDKQKYLTKNMRHFVYKV